VVGPGVEGFGSRVILAVGGPEFGRAGFPPHGQCLGDVRVEGVVLVNFGLRCVLHVGQQPLCGFLDLVSGDVEFLRRDGHPFEVVSRRDDSF
jgi:hypothetical protein